MRGSAWATLDGEEVERHVDGSVQGRAGAKRPQSAPQRRTSVSGGSSNKRRPSTAMPHRGQAKEEDDDDGQHRMLRQLAAQKHCSVSNDDEMAKWMGMRLGGHRPEEIERMVTGVMSYGDNLNSDGR